MTKETTWTIDAAHSEIAFKVKHLMIAHVSGTFTRFNASIRTTDMDFMTVAIDFAIDPSSITTGDDKRDEHLKSKEFFDVAHYKTISFVANTISKNKLGGAMEIWGELTMKDITKHLKLDVSFGGIIHDPWGNDRAGFTITGMLNRKDWDLTWNSSLAAGGILVGEEVMIACEVQLIKATPQDSIMELDADETKNSASEALSAKR